MPTWMDVVRDFRLAFRKLHRDKRFTAVTVGTLALGIGATTVIFSILQAVVLRPLPYPDPDRLVAIEAFNNEQNIHHAKASMGDFVDWREQARSFEAIAASGHASLVLTEGGEPREISTAAVSVALFEILGVRPLQGRTFRPEEETPGLDQVVILSHGIWQRRFGGDPGVIGRTLDLSGYQFEVIGVMPPGFDYPDREIDFWSPMALDPEHLVRRRRGMTVVARLRSGTSLEQAQQELDLLTRRLEEEYPDTNAGWGAAIVPLHDKLVRDVRPALFLLLGATLLVLLIAWANVANLQLMRASIRSREVALRAALGSPRRALVQLLIVESLVLSLVGGVLGLILAYLSNRALIASTPYEIFRLHETRIDGSVLLFALVLSVVLGLTLGALPAIRGFKLDLSSSLKEGALRGSRGAGRHGVGEALMVTEVAIALLLLIGYGLLVKSFVRLTQVDPGFRSDNLLVASLILPVTKYGERHQQAAAFKEMSERIGTLPGVESVATSVNVPMAKSGIKLNLPFALEGRQETDSTHDYRAEIRRVSPNYLRTMGIPLVTGRDFTDGDRADTPRVAIINATMAERFWPDGRPLGERLILEYRGAASYEIVGVVSDVRHYGFENAPVPEIYLPFEQVPYYLASLMVRTRNDPSDLAQSVKEKVWERDPDQAIAIETMDEILTALVADRRFTLTLLLVFTAAALILAVIGIYGIMGYNVVRRTTEIGVRMALGATVGNVLWAVLGRALAVTSIGLVLGLAGAYWITRLLKSFLYGVAANDLPTFIAASAVSVLAALLGSYLPARRAIRVDPVNALHYE